MRQSTAFTLVELLVVIGIIALLIGILLPVLGKARERSYTAKCAANMRSAVQALTFYTSAYKGWLPGPCTSGMIWPKSGDQMNGTETSNRTSPVQNMDWVSPTLGQTFRWPENDYQRMKKIFNVQLACPANQTYFTSVFLGPESVSDLLTNSYSAVVQFHTFPAREPPLVAGSLYPRIANDMFTSISLTAPPDYTPKITHVGPPSRKVFLVEGSRFYDPAKNFEPSFNGLRHQISGGNFMICGPFINAAGTPYQLPLNQTTYNKPISGIAATGAWRHEKGKMNLAFFDGHVETRPVAESIQADLYLPPGTKINSASATFDPTDKAGQIVQ